MKSDEVSKLIKTSIQELLKNKVLKKSQSPTVRNSSEVITEKVDRNRQRSDLTLEKEKSEKKAQPPSIYRNSEYGSRISIHKKPERSQSFKS